MLAEAYNNPDDIENIASNTIEEDSNKLKKFLLKVRYLLMI